MIYEQVYITGVMLICTECGSVVEPRYRDLHTAFHNEDQEPDFDLYAGQSIPGP